MQFGGRDQRRMLRCLVAAGVAVFVGAWGLTACAAPVPTSTPTSTTIFASEEDALAAAIDSYQAYLAVSDAVSADGGKDPERIRPHVTVAFWESELAGIGELVRAGYRTIGSSSFDRPTLVATDRTSTATLQICLDVSQVRVIDMGGIDVTPGDRAERTRLEVDFTIASQVARSLLIAKSEVWTDQEPC